MCLDQFYYYLTQEDGKEAIWFHNVSRHKMIVQSLSFTFHNKDDDGTDWYGDIPYTIELGGMKISSFLSDWSNDLEEIRHSIVHYVFTGKTKINLCFEDSPTEIRLRRRRVLASTEDIGTGRLYNWKDFVQVFVKPNEFIKDDYQLFGICEERQVIQEIYEAFLRVGWWGYKYEGGGGEDAWDYPSMVFYNKIKSPLIEDYFCERKIDDSKAHVRQVNVDHILTIWPDIFETISDEDRVACSDIEENDDFIIWVGDVEYKLHIPGIYQWQKDFEQNADFAESKMDEDFDIDAWHRQGLALAAMIREQLPTNIDLWYKAAFEDSKNRDKRPLLIYNK